MRHQFPGARNTTSAPGKVGVCQLRGLGMKQGLQVQRGLHVVARDKHHYVFHIG
jgi:hypothetical protein